MLSLICRYIITTRWQVVWPPEATSYAKRWRISFTDMLDGRECYLCTQWSALVVWDSLTYGRNGYGKVNYWNSQVGSQYCLYWRLQVIQGERSWEIGRFRSKYSKFTWYDSKLVSSPCKYQFPLLTPNKYEMLQGLSFERYVSTTFLNTSSWIMSHKKLLSSSLSLYRWGSKCQNSCNASNLCFFYLSDWRFGQIPWVRLSIVRREEILILVRHREFHVLLLEVLSLQRLHFRCRGSRGDHGCRMLTPGKKIDSWVLPTRNCYHWILYRPVINESRHRAYHEWICEALFSYLSLIDFLIHHSSTRHQIRDKTDMYVRNR